MPKGGKTPPPPEIVLAHLKVVRPQFPNGGEFEFDPPPIPKVVATPPIWQRQKGTAEGPFPHQLLSPYQQYGCKMRPIMMDTKCETCEKHMNTYVIHTFLYGG